MDKLTSIRIKYSDGTYLDEVPIGVLAQNVGYDSSHNLIQVLGSIDVESNGTIQQQINRLFNEKLNTSDLSSYVNSKITTDVSTWLANNVNPVGSAVIVDQSLSISGAAADAKVAGDEVNTLKSITTRQLSPAKFSPNLVKGQYIKLSNGRKYNSSNYARTSSLWYGAGQKYAISVTNPDYEFNLMFYDQNGSLDDGNGYIKGTEYITNDVIIVPSYAVYFGINFRRVDEQAITDDDIVTIQSSILYFAPTDKTLTQENKAADAKIVGQMIEATKNDIKTLSAYNSSEIEYAPLLTLGRYFRISDGISQTGTKYARTNILWYGKGYRTAIALEDNVYEFCLAFYGANGEFVNGTDYIKSSGYVQGGTVVNIIPEAILFGISFRRVDQAELTDSDSTAISAALKCYNSTAEIAKSAAQSALASCESIVVSKDIDKDAGTVKNYYIGYTQGKVYSSARTVKTLCLECAPNSIYKISHSKSMQFVVASYSSEPVLNLIANKVYNGREESETTFITDGNAAWIGIYYYSSANNPDITPEETYDALSISTVGLDTIAETVADLAQAQQSSIAYGFYSSNEVIEMPTTFEGVIELYDGLVAEHPDYVTKNVLTSGDVTNYEYVFTHGDYNRDSSAKRNPDQMIKKPVIILSSGVHGYERSAVISLYKLMNDICNCNYALADLIEYVTIKVIPVGCPWSYTNNSRLNANGVNINRNFATSTWGDYDPGTPGSPDYAGPSAGSEDETKILQAWMEENSDALFYVDFHNSNFSSEVAMLSGSDEADSTAFKKKYLLGMNKIIPYWQKSRGMASANNYYCYTGGYGTIEGRVSRNYAYEAGIHLSFSHETSWNVNRTGKHSQTTLNVGAEAMGNFLLGMTDYYKEI